MYHFGIYKNIYNIKKNLNIYNHYTNLFSTFFYKYICT